MSSSSSHSRKSFPVSSVRGASHISSSSNIISSQKSSTNGSVGSGSVGSGSVGSVGPGSGSVGSGSVGSGSVGSGSVGSTIHSRSSCKLVGLQTSSGAGSVGFIGSGSVGSIGPGSGSVGSVVVVIVGSVVVVIVGSVVVVVGQSTVKLGPQRFQPPEKELGVVEVLYLHLTFCPLGTFTDPLSELPGATD